MFLLSKSLFSFLLAVFLIDLCAGRPWFVPKKVDLRITNNLGEDYLVLNLHCKSKDDDLGTQAVAPHQFFEFKFQPNFWYTTQYFCVFWWGSESHWFDVYIENRDADRCDDKCWWMVNKDGPCLLNDKVQRYTFCESWNPKQPEGLGQMGAGNNTARMYDEFEYLEGSGKRGKRGK